MGLSAPETGARSQSATDSRTGITRSLFYTAGSQLATTGLGGLVGVAILLRFGKSASTDAVFAAYGVYGIALILCLSLRTTIVARLTREPKPFAAFDRLLGAGAILLVLAAVPLLAFSGPTASLVAGALGTEAQSIARQALQILWLAVAGQMVAALAAAALGAMGEFGLSSIAYGLGAPIALALLFAAAPVIGVIAVPSGVAVGSVLIAGIMVGRMLCKGYRMSRAEVLTGARDMDTLMLMVKGAVLSVVVQVNYVIGLAAAARIAPGALTLFSTAFSGLALVVGLTAAPCVFVLAAPGAQEWDRRTDSLNAFLRPVFRLGLILLLLAIGVVLLVGGPLINGLFGRALGIGDGDQIVNIFLGLSGSAAATLVLQVPLLAAYALLRHGAIALLSLASMVAQLALIVVATPTHQLALLGVATSVSSLVLLMLVVRLVYGNETQRVFHQMLGDAARPVPIWIASFGAAALIGWLAGASVWRIALSPGAVVVFCFCCMRCSQNTLICCTVQDGP